jgi:8-oxo-dGTP diphosphatase
MIATMNNALEESVVRRPVVGVGVAVFRRVVSGLEVLLILRGKPPRQGQWSIPGGRQEWGETLKQAALREVQEETSIVITDLCLIDVVDGLMHDDNNALSHHLSLIDYRAIWVSGEPCAGDDADEVRWVPLSEIGLYNMWPETTRIILAGADMDQEDAKA